MKCPKCGYTSFDHNDTCPRCRKDIAAERHRLNLPAFTPDPPHLLGLLNGEVDAKKIGLETEQRPPPPVLESGDPAGPEDSQALQAIEMALETDHERQISVDARPAIHAGMTHASFKSFQEVGVEKDLEGVDFQDLSLDDPQPPSSLIVESVNPEDADDIDFSSEALSLAGDELAELEGDLLLGEDDALLDKPLLQNPDHAGGLTFPDDEAALEEGLEGPLDLDQLASMVESINEDAIPAFEGQKRSFDPALGIEQMMPDEIMDLDVSLGSRSRQADSDKRDPVRRHKLRTETPL
jgi:hypothetical protein